MMTANRQKKPRFRRLTVIVTVTASCFAALIVSSCQQNEPEPAARYLAVTKAPAGQVFRWSNGGLPSSLDPARASAPPETDIVRAIYEGLTETDPASLKAIPAVAETWASEDNHTTWTFELRRDAVWTNGSPVTADDFVRSWKRLSRLGKDVAHHRLFRNIIGMEADADRRSAYRAKTGGVRRRVYQAPRGANNTAGERTNRATPVRNARNGPDREVDFGVTTDGDFRLRVRLRHPDPDFPRLAAHPVLRPVYGELQGSQGDKNGKPVTNGAFRLESMGAGGVVLVRSPSYYGREQVFLERVHFVPAGNADSALKAYREGRVDAVTNAEFEPLALKLLTPFADFRRTTHSALNLYEFNRGKAPFDDRRVREALAISIERERLTSDIMSGATKPAFRFLPFRGEDQSQGLTEDPVRARLLLEKAGYAGGKGFPMVRLVVNRNNVQQQVAKMVAGMWEKNLRIATEVVVREMAELEVDREQGDFDLIRRGVVLPTSDETANMLAIFPEPAEHESSKAAAQDDRNESPESQEPDKTRREGAADNTGAGRDLLTDVSEFDGLPPDVREELMVSVGQIEKIILNEEAALVEIPAIPLYFPTGYSIVRPYILGFEANPLDAQLLRLIRIDNRWQPDSPRAES